MASGSQTIEEKYRLDSEFIPASGSAAYTEKAYWDLRFTKEESKEWLASYKDVKDLVAAVLTEHDAPARDKAKVLLVGVGNSSLGQDMVEDGYSDVAATDYSEVVVERMRAKVGEMDGRLKWLVADMLDLKGLDDASFDVYFDKAAFDAVVADGGDSWSPPDELLEKGKQIMQEAARVLKPGGLYLQISFGQPHFRKQFLLSDETRHLWEGEVKKKDVPAGLGYFLYVLQRKRAS
jgi:EEF1A lysine methyltransferase 4